MHGHLTSMTEKLETAWANGLPTKSPSFYKANSNHPLPNAQGSYLRPRRYSNSTLRRMRIRNAFLTLVTVIAAIVLINRYTGHHTSSSLANQNGQPRIAKVTALYGHPHPLYERAIKTHKKHNQKHGYPQYILQRQITNGYWNKFAYLLHLVVQELAKPENERIEWFYWSDPNVIILNPNIPLHIFLPPPEISDVNLVATRDRAGLNPASFFIRTDEMSMRLLVSILAQPAVDPEETSKSYAKDQELFQKVALSDDFKRFMLYTPRPWFNAEQKRAHADDDPDDFAGTFEGGYGALLVNFPRLNGDRWQSMSKYLDQVERHFNPYSVPLSSTSYIANTTEYWNQIREALQLVADTEELLNPVGEWQGKYPGIEYAKGKVVDMVAQEADQADVLEEAVKGLRGEYDDVREAELKARNDYDVWRAEMTDRERKLASEMEGDLKKEREARKMKAK